MLKHQLYHSHSYNKSLLTWRGMQAWCLGRRASSLCRFFIRIRTRPKLRLASIFPFTKSRNRQASFVRWLAAHTKQQGRIPLCCLPTMKQGHDHCQNTSDQHQDAPLQLQQKDAVAHSQHHDMHVGLQKLFKRVDESHTEVRHTHAFSTRLGSGEGSFMSCLQRQSSSGEISFNSLSISSSSSSSSSSLSSSLSSSASGSFHRVSGSKLKEACAKVVHGGPSICELVAGNQFLVHLSAAPVVASPLHSSCNGGLGTGGNTTKDKKFELNPSMGLPSLRHKESDTNDRIVFFK